MTTIDRIKHAIAFAMHVVPAEGDGCAQCFEVATRYERKDDDNALELCPLGRAIHDAERLTGEARS